MVKRFLQCPNAVESEFEDDDEEESDEEEEDEEEDESEDEDEREDQILLQSEDLSSISFIYFTFLACK